MVHGSHYQCLSSRPLTNTHRSLSPSLNEVLVAVMPAECLLGAATRDIQIVSVFIFLWFVGDRAGVSGGTAGAAARVQSAVPTGVPRAHPGDGHRGRCRRLRDRRGARRHPDPGHRRPVRQHVERSADPHREHPRPGASPSPPCGEPLLPLPTSCLCLSSCLEGLSSCLEVPCLMLNGAFPRGWRGFPSCLEVPSLVLERAFPRAWRCLSSCLEGCCTAP